MARPVARWNGWGKYLSGIVVLCFFLPFFGVSCKGMDVIHFSGVDLAFGLAPGGLIMEAAKEDGGGKMSGGDMKMEGMDKAPVEPLAIVALVAALVVFGASTRKQKGARTLAFAAALATLGALGGMFVMETRKLADAVDEQQAKEKKPSSAMARDMEKEMEITTGSRYGFWVVALGMLGVAAMAGAAVKQGEDPPLPPSPPPQPA